MNCSNTERLLPKNFDPIERSNSETAAKYISEQAALRYLVDDDSWFGDYYQALEKRRSSSDKTLYSGETKKLKSAIISDDQKEYIRQLRKAEDKTYANLYKKYSSKSSNYRDYQETLAFCRLKELAESDKSVLLTDRLKVIVEASKSKTRQARVGYFTIKVHKCYVKSLPLTGNPYTEPKEWPGSRFLVVDASFKNEDNEGRLPSEGSLIINYQGRPLRYDNTESILQDGYGIYFKSVNPLISMPTRIVYRIPDSVSGEVSWEPGRNSEGKKLWCTFIVPESVPSN